MHHVIPDYAYDLNRRLTDVQFYQSYLDLDPSDLLDIADDLDQAGVEYTLPSLDISSSRYREYKDLIGRFAYAKVCEHTIDAIKWVLPIKYFVYGGIDSPREYNFRGDYLSVLPVWSTDDIVGYFRNEFVKGVNKEKFSAYLAKYDSYDGFISFIPSKLDEVMEIDGDGDWKLAHVMLDYVIDLLLESNEIEKVDDDDVVEYARSLDVYDYLDDESKAKYDELYQIYTDHFK
jgi:hypothetical protein